MQRLMTSLKTTKKAIEQLIEAAESHNLPVEVRRRGDVDNIYIGGKLTAERFPGYGGVIVDIEPVEVEHRKTAELMFANRNDEFTVDDLSRLLASHEAEVAELEAEISTEQRSQQDAQIPRRRSPKELDAFAERAKRT